MDSFFKGDFGQYFTPRELIRFSVDLLDVEHSDLLCDPASGPEASFYTHSRRAAEKANDYYAPGSAENYAMWHGFARNNLFGIEINEEIARVAKMNMVLHGDGHTNIVRHDALVGERELKKLNKTFAFNNFDLVLTNPPFGAKIRLDERPFLADFTLGNTWSRRGKGTPRKRQSSEIVFIERVWQLLKPATGRAAVVLPDGILTNSRTGYVRDFIFDRFEVLAVVSLPVAAFMHYGAGVKASIVFLRKLGAREKPVDDKPFFLAEASLVGYDATGREGPNQLPDILDAYRKFVADPSPSWWRSPLSETTRAITRRRTRTMNSGAVGVTATGARVLATAQRHFVRRADPRHLRMSVEVNARYASPKYPLVSLGRLLAEPITYGTSERLSEEAIGHAVLRMNNLTMRGWDTADVKYLDVPLEEVDNLHLKRGDILVNRTNGSISLVGKAAVFDLDGEWLFASYLLRVRVDQRRILPEYLVYFLNSPAGRLQIERVARPILMVNVSPPELRGLQIPLPTISEQRKLVKPVADALKAGMSKERDAAVELTAINTAFYKAVGIPPLGTTFTNVFATSPAQSRLMNRLGAQFFHPERAAAVAAVLAAKRATPKALRQVANFSTVKGSPGPGDQFLGLAAVESDTGELLAGSDDPTDGKLFEQGDVLFSRLRPYLNKVHCADAAGCCSPEFHVLRVKGADFDPTYLAIALRSPLVLAQTRHLTTGNTHPRAVEADAGSILLPMPEMDVQTALAKQLDQRRSKSHKIRDEAHDLWMSAQIDFNDALLGQA